MSFQLPAASLLAVALLASSSDAAQRSAPNTLTCAGPFARDLTHASLEKAFGKRNVAVQSVGIGEGETVKASVVFPRDKARRLEIIWRNEKVRRNPHEIRLGIASAWRIPDGIGLNTPLAEVEQRNGRPFTFSGFGWDYGGTTIDWQGGKLASQPGGCTLELRFMQTATTNADIDGDRSFSSDDPGMRAAAPVVEGLSLKYGE